MSTTDKVDNKALQQNTTFREWQPTATITLLQYRAQLLTQIRQFFAERKILEVETPLLGHTTVTDPHLHSFQTQYLSDNPQQQQTLYLQTSPEYAMKRLLAAGSGAIYQICKAFRNQGESGRYHNPEFTLLEWYRPGFNHHQLMDEVENLLQTVLTCEPAQRFSYAEIFQQYLQIDPHHISIANLKKITSDLKLLNANHHLTTIDDYLHLLMTHIIEPQLPALPIFIYDFPVSQAALAKISAGNPAVAERFEVYVHGLELANGYHELNDATEQRQRFIKNLAARATLAYPHVSIDEYLLAALPHMPQCAGVALGLDRLLMVKTKLKNIAQVISFPLST